MYKVIDKRDDTFSFYNDLRDFVEEHMTIDDVIESLDDIYEPVDLPIVGKMHISTIVKNLASEDDLDMLLNDEIDYRNPYNESKAQAVQRFLMYACDRLHAVGAYVSADVFGECAEDYVCAYGQYWPAITNVVDAISAMPYPDHYGASGDWLPWEHPYETLYSFGTKAAERQTEVPTPGAVRTWIQAYSAIKEPYTYYGPNQIAAQIEALRDSGNTGGYMTWNGASSITKYYDIQSALD